MAGKFGVKDYAEWDWLPGAATEIADYLTRLLAEGSIAAHAVDARSKSIASFQQKCETKGYTDPRQQVTDTVAVRLIMYSVTDRDRAAELVRERFEVVEDRNPGEFKDAERRGYDCAHLIVTGEKEGRSREWLVAGGSLSKYFDRFGGLEIQIRTVASHAWAEFEHSRRYKGVGYSRISDHDQRTIDQLFGAAADARRALDETFTAIDRLLANPTRDESLEDEIDDEDVIRSSTFGAAVDDGASPGDAGLDDADIETDEGPPGTDAPVEPTPLDAGSLAALLARRFPDDGRGSERGLEFGCDLARACGLRTVNDLELELAAVDSAEVRSLMDTATSVTRVRRLDDELLAVFGEEYIEATESLGSVGHRGDQLRWRFDRLRGKVAVRRRTVNYQLFGSDCPQNLVGLRVPAARMVRELAILLADRLGPSSVELAGAISRSADLPASTRARPVRLTDGSQLWVATNLRRAASEELMAVLLEAATGMDLTILRNGEAFRPHR